ncbi:hypothetical protein D3C87_2132080 [compost metagenome]
MLRQVEAKGKVEFGDAVGAVPSGDVHKDSGAGAGVFRGVVVVDQGNACLLGGIGQRVGHQ